MKMHTTLFKVSIVFTRSKRDGRPHAHTDGRNHGSVTICPPQRNVMHVFCHIRGHCVHVFCFAVVLGLPFRLEVS